jgi:hypothetical protein
LHEDAATFDDRAMVRRLDDLIEAEVDDEILALHVEQGVCYGFNVTAARVWSSLREPKRIAELRAQLLDEFDVDEETCGRELSEILALLAAQKLVAIEPPKQA